MTPGIKASPFFFGNFYRMDSRADYKYLEEGLSDPTFIKAHLAQDLYYIGKRLGHKMAWIERLNHVQRNQHRLVGSGVPTGADRPLAARKHTCTAPNRNDESYVAALMPVTATGPQPPSTSQNNSTYRKGLYTELLPLEVP